LFAFCALEPCPVFALQQKQSESQVFQATNQYKEYIMNSLVSKTSKFRSFINDPRTRKAVQFGKDNWRDIAAVAAVALIMEDVDTAADLAESSFTLDVMTAITEGVI
jgi:hypothetical protein